MAMIWSQLEALPQSSVAVHVRVIVFSCAQLPAAVAELYVIVTTSSQLSVAVAPPIAPSSVIAATAQISPKQSALFGAGLQFNVVPAGQEITGAVLSVTVMICAQLSTLPTLSVAVHVRVIADS